MPRAKRSPSPPRRGANARGTDADTDALVSDAGGLAALALPGCEALQGEVRRRLRLGAVPPECVPTVLCRMEAALSVARMGQGEVAARLREAEAEFEAFVQSCGWFTLVDAAQPRPADTIARLATLRVRSAKLHPPPPLAAIPIQPTPDPAPPARRPRSGSGGASRVSKLLPGDIAEVAMMSGPWVGQYVDCTIHRRAPGGRSFAVHVLPTKRFDGAVGNSNRLVEGVPHHFVRIKTTPRIFRGQLYMSVDENGEWWPVTVKDENTDGTYTVAVHDGVHGRVWPAVHASNIRPLRHGDTGGAGGSLPPGAHTAAENDHPLGGALPSQAGGDDDDDDAAAAAVPEEGCGTQSSAACSLSGDDGVSADPAGGGSSGEAQLPVYPRDVRQQEMAPG